jgi:hypothetical protein
LPPLLLVLFTTTGATRYVRVIFLQSLCRRRFRFHYRYRYRHYNTFIIATELEQQNFNNRFLAISKVIRDLKKITQHLLAAHRTVGLRQMSVH